MKLIYSPNSPYARKTRIVWRECNVDGVTELLDSPISPETAVPKTNPLGKVPVLITADGTTLIDSPLICAYFDSIGAGPRMMPEPSIKRLQVSQLEALCDGILDAAVATVFERKRPDKQQSQYWLKRWSDAITRTLEVVEERLSSRDNQLDQGTLTVACTTDYLSCRLPQVEWRSSYPALAELSVVLLKRSSFVETAPTG